MGSRDAHAAEETRLTQSSTHVGLEHTCTHSCVRQGSRPCMSKQVLWCAHRYSAVNANTQVRLSAHGARKQVGAHSHAIRDGQTEPPK
eukprot:6208439-Pleurochrysis_carterae.AAC.4